ncbi:MAG: protein kinase, partial [Bacteroidota bacterium]
LVLPYCANGSVMKMTGQTDEATIAKLLVQIGGALEYLHSQDPPVIHRDIKPENILADISGNYYLSDFGISSKLRRTLTKSMGRSQESSGTTAFMAPELFQAKRQVLPESDIFAFGTMLYELITDELPFGQIGGAMLMNGAEVPDISDQCSAALAKLIAACLNIDIAKRPTAAELKEAGDFYLINKYWNTNNAGKPKSDRKTQPFHEPLKDKHETLHAILNNQEIEQFISAQKGQWVENDWLAFISHLEGKYGKVDQRELMRYYEDKKSNQHVDVPLVGNGSGQGSRSKVPPEINRWNWGAFFLNWIWGIGNKTYLTLLCLIPFFSFIWIFVIGAYGSKWAWQNNKWDSIEQFKKVQRKWAKWGIGLFIGSFTLIIVISVISVLLTSESISPDANTYEVTMSDYSVSIPECFYEIPELHESATLKYGDSTKTAYIVVLEESVSTVDSAGYDFNSYADKIEEDIKTNISKFERQSDYQSIGNFTNSRAFEAIAEVNGVQIFYIMGVIKSSSNYYRVVSWTLESKKSENYEVLWNMMKSFREL